MDIWPTGEWYATALNNHEGLHHIDLRVIGNSIQLTVSPADCEGAADVWQVRLRNDDNGQALRRLARALRADTPHGQFDAGSEERVLAFIPNSPESDVGELVLGLAEIGPDGIHYLRRAELPMHLWTDAGEVIEELIPWLDPAVPHEDWRFAEFTSCPGCARPIFPGMWAGLLIHCDAPVGAEAAEAACYHCMSGHTLRNLDECGFAIPEQQRSILEALNVV